MLLCAPLIETSRPRCAIAVRSAPGSSPSPRGFARRMAGRLQHARAAFVGGRAERLCRRRACQAEPESAWWEAYGDPVLSDLIRRAARENRDVRIAAQRVQAARAGVTISRSF
jgi:outer membrane protein TolC